MGGDFREWSGKQRELLTSLDETQDNFRCIWRQAPLHCIGAYPYFSERITNGVRFADWQRQFIEDETMPESVYCQGLGCFEDDLVTSVQRMMVVQDADFGVDERRQAEEQAGQIQCRTPNNQAPDETALQANVLTGTTSPPPVIHFFASTADVADSLGLLNPRRSAP